MHKPELPTASKLALTLPLGRSETPTSFASRLAALNGAGGVVSFCTDLGLRWRDIVVGDEMSISRLAKVSDASASDLKFHATRLLDRRQYRMANLLLARWHIETSALRVCPDCLISDHETGGDYSAYERSFWRLKFLDVCPVHRSPLLSIRPDEIGGRTRDVAEMIKWNWLEIAAMAGKGHRRSRSTAEKYFMTRYYGRKRDGILDDLDLITAVRASQAVGAALSSNGRSTVPTGDEKQKAATLNVGFEALREGAESMKTALTALAIRQNRPTNSLIGSMGALTPWLVKTAHDELYADITAMIRESAGGQTPTNATVVPESSMEQDETLLARGDAASRLGVDADLLLRLQDQPWWPVQPYAPGVRFGYSNSEINSLLREVKSRASRVSSFSEPRRIGFLYSDPEWDGQSLLRWVVQRKIRYKLDPKFNGLRGLIIEMPSLRETASKENAPISREIAAKMLSVSNVTIDWLLQNGKLEVGDFLGTKIDVVGLRRFHSRYVSAHEIARLLGMTTSAVLKEQRRNRIMAELFEIGHTPIFARKTVWLPKILVPEGANADSCGENAKSVAKQKSHLNKINDLGSL